VNADIIDFKIWRDVRLSERAWLVTSMRRSWLHKFGGSEWREAINRIDAWDKQVPDTKTKTKMRQTP
jgi:hypothetical protein